MRVGSARFLRPHDPRVGGAHQQRQELRDQEGDEPLEDTVAVNLKKAPSVASYVHLTKVSSSFTESFAKDARTHEETRIESV